MSYKWDMKWKVVPICDNQLKDVRAEDLLNDGLYRKCDVYRGGGGYDLFPSIFNRKYGFTPNPVQFVVQLFGCNLDCPYCYVTREGFLGAYTKVTNSELISAFTETNLQVFHLMGGAPGLYLRNWINIVKQLPEGTIFHSDLMLTEHSYDSAVIKNLSIYPVLIAVNIKGTTDEEWQQMTRKKAKWSLFWDNFITLVVNDFPMYFTFTGLPKNSVQFFWDQCYALFPSETIDPYRDTAYTIDLIKYKALQA